MRRIIGFRLLATGTWLVSHLAAQNATIPDTPPGGSYTAPGGGVPRDLSQKLSDTVNAHDFTPCNGKGDDLPGLEKAQAWLLSRGGGTLHIPAGACMLSHSFVLHNQVNLEGDNVAASQLNAAPDFPPNQAVLEVGIPHGPDGHFQTVRDLTVNAASDPGSIAIQAFNMQEGSILNNLMVNGYGKYGIDLEGGQNFHLDDIYSGVQPESQTAVGVRLSKVASRFAMSHLTIYGVKRELPEFPKMDVSETNAAIELDNGSDARIVDLHVEGFRYGVRVGKWSYAEIDDFYGAVNLPTMVWFQKESGGGTVRHLFMYPWQEPFGVPQAQRVGIRDDLHNVLTNAPVNVVVDEYITNPNSLFTTARGVTSSLDQLQLASLQARTAAVEHVEGSGGTPSCVPGPAAGAGAICRVIAGHDAALELQIATGLAPSTGPLFTVTWAMPFTSVPFAQTFPTSLNAATVALVYLRSQSTPAVANFAAATPLTARSNYTLEILSIQ